MNIKEESYLESKTNLSSPSSSQDSSSSISHYEANQMLFNQQSYFEGYHADSYSAAQMPSMLGAESSLLTFQSGLGHMGHYNYDTSTMQSAMAFGQAKLNSPVSSSSASPGIKAETDETKKNDSEDSSSSASADSTSSSSTPFQPLAHHDSTIMPADQVYQNYHYQNQYACNQNRLSVCLKYNGTTNDQLNQIAAAAVAAVVSNSSGVPSSSSSSSSISMEEYSDGSPQSNTYNNSHGHFQNVPRAQANMPVYSPNNNLVGFYNNLENSANYYSNQQKNLNISSSSSSSSASYPTRESDYFAYQNYLNNHSEPNEIMNVAANHGYPLQSSPSLIHNQFVGSHLAQFNSLDQQYLHQNFGTHLPVNNNSYALTANSNASRRCSPESNSSNAANYVKSSQYASK